MYFCNIINKKPIIILSIGLIVAYEREQIFNSEANLPLGFVSELNFDTKYVGTNMKVYTGSPHFFILNMEINYIGVIHF